MSGRFKIGSRRVISTSEFQELCCVIHICIHPHFGVERQWKWHGEILLTIGKQKWCSSYTEVCGHMCPEKHVIFATIFEGYDPRGLKTNKLMALSRQQLLKFYPVIAVLSYEPLAFQKFQLYSCYFSNSIKSLFPAGPYGVVGSDISLSEFNFSIQEQFLPCNSHGWIKGPGMYDGYFLYTIILCFA